MNTEEDVSIALGTYRDTTLRQKVENLLAEKYPLQDRPVPEDTIVSVSVNKRLEYNLTKQYKGFDIGWSDVQEKLESMSHFFYQGRRLTLKITFRFRPQASVANTRARSCGFPSATRQRRREQAFQRDAEVHATGEPAHWRTVYSLLRCPGRPCVNQQGWCWRDPHSGKHYKLLTSHLRQLVQHMNNGNRFESHGDVPDSVRRNCTPRTDNGAAIQDSLDLRCRQRN